MSEGARRGLLERALGRARRTLWPTTLEREHRRWVADRGDATRRLDYPLGSRSLVLDVGGYCGEWAAQVLERFDCALHLFEPVPAFADRARRRLAAFPRAAVHEHGLGARTRETEFALAADGSSALRGPGRLRVPLRAAAEVFDALGIAAVDLMKVNIEGGEYELLEHLLDTGLIARIDHLQIQFHDFVPDARRRMRALEARLAATHEPAWRYEFVWESWRRRGASPRPGAAG